MNKDSFHAREHRTWIFQTNPKRYDLVTKLKKLKQIRWRVVQFKESIHEGDTVYLRLSGQKVGYWLTALR